MNSNDYNDVVDLEVCGFIKNTKIQISRAGKEKKIIFK